MSVSWVGRAARLRRRALAAAIGWYGLVLASAPVGRAAVDALRARGMLAFAVAAAFVGFGMILTGVVLRLRRQASLERRAVLALLGATAVMLVSTQALPRFEERIHVLEYGVLGALLYSALPAWGCRRTAASAVLVILAGWGEEGLQALLPTRVYDWSDVALNALAGVAGTGTMAVGLGRRHRADAEKSS